MTTAVVVVDEQVGLVTGEHAVQGAEGSAVRLGAHRGAIAVPAAQVSRVAEWSLGDGIEVPARVADIDRAE